MIAPGEKNNNWQQSKVHDIKLQIIFYFFSNFDLSMYADMSNNKSLHHLDDCKSQFLDLHLNVAELYTKLKMSVKPSKYVGKSVFSHAM